MCEPGVGSHLGRPHRDQYGSPAASPVRAYRPQVAGSAARAFSAQLSCAERLPRPGATLCRRRDDTRCQRSPSKPAFVCVQPRRLRARVRPVTAICRSCQTSMSSSLCARLLACSLAADASHPATPQWKHPIAHSQAKARPLPRFDVLRLLRTGPRKFPRATP